MNTIGICCLFLPVLCKRYLYAKNRAVFFGYFDGGIVSAYHQCVKPEEKIYRLLLDKYDLKPEETLFIDDIAENIEAAGKIGIDTIHLTDYNALSDRLRNKNIIF